MNSNIVTAVSTGQDIEGILAFILLYLLVIVAMLFLFHLIVAYFLYRDAEKHGMSGGLWAIAVLILPIFLLFFGVLIYLVAVLVVATAYAIIRSRNAEFRPSRRDED